MSIPESPEYSRAKVAVIAYLQGEDLKATLADTVVIPWPPAEDQLPLYTNASRESLVAFEACIKFFERFTENSQPIPHQLASWVSGVLHGSITRPKSPGRSKHDHSNRNAVIRDAVRIAEEYGLLPTRSDASQSGCDLVSELLIENFNIPLGYGGVKSVWNNRRK